MRPDLRIGVVSQWWPVPGEEGRNPFLLEHVQALAPASVSLIWPHVACRPPTLRRWSIWDGTHEVRTVHVPYPSRFLRRPTGATLGGWAGELCLERHERFDLVVVHCFAGSSIVGCSMAASHGVPLLYVEHWSAVAERQVPRSLEAELIHLASRADVVLPVSHNLGLALAEWCPSSDIRVIGNALSESEFIATAPDPMRRTIAMVADFRPVKGHDLVVDTVSAESSMLRRDGWSVVLAGDGPELPRVMEAVRLHGLEDVVQFTGRLTRAEVAQLVASSNWTMLASRSENRPLAAIESLAVGRPVLAPRVGGMAEIIQPGMGILYDRTVDGLAGALRRVVQGATDVHPWKQLSVDAVRRHGVRALADRYDAVFAEIVGDGVG